MRKDAMLAALRGTEADTVSPALQGKPPGLCQYSSTGTCPAVGKGALACSTTQCP